MSGSLGKSDDCNNQEQIVREIKDQAKVALNCLRKYFSDNGGKSLFPDIDHAIHLAFVYKKPALVTDGLRSKVVLPHSHRTISNTSVCLILPDLDQTDKAKTDPDVDKQAREWADLVAKDHGLTSKHYSKVLKYAQDIADKAIILTKTQLERENHTYKDRRALASSYDLFLVDSRVGKAVRSFLGNDFYKAHKVPIFFEYTKPLSSSIDEALSTVLFPTNRYMTRASLNVGHMGQTIADLSANVDEAVNRVLDICPGGLVNVRSIYLQPSSSKPSLPIYVDLGCSNDVTLSSEEKYVQPDRIKVADECNTLPDGLSIEVRKNGKIRVVRAEDKSGVHYPTVQDEWDTRDLDNTMPTIDLKVLEKKKLKKQKKNQMKKRILKKKRSAESPKLTVPMKKQK